MNDRVVAVVVVVEASPDDTCVQIQDQIITSTFIIYLIFFVLPIRQPIFFFFSLNQDWVIFPGMAITPFPSSILDKTDSNSRSFGRESSSLPTRPD